MPIFWWKTAILITKKARYIVPVVIAAAGSAVGFIGGLFTGRKTKRGKDTKQQDED
jgi:hypothetical protein